MPPEPPKRPSDLETEEDAIHTLFRALRKEVTRVSDGFQLRVRNAMQRGEQRRHSGSVLGMFTSAVVEALNLVSSAAGARPDKRVGPADVEPPKSTSSSRAPGSADDEAPL